MGYRKLPLVDRKALSYLHKSEDIDVYTEYVLGETDYKYTNNAANDTFMVVEGSIELMIDGQAAQFIKGDVIEVDVGTPHGPISSKDGAILLVIHRRK